MLKKAFEYFNTSDLLFLKIINKIVLNLTSDDYKYLLIYYKIRTGKKLNLDNPITFNEKIQWLKLYDRQHEYTQMADKHGVTEFVRQRIGNEYIIPLLGFWNKFEEINFNTLPDQFVLKCTHDSGGVIICKDKKNLDFIDKSGVKININDVKKNISKSMGKNYFYKGREWVYKNIPPRIIAQQYIKNESGGLLNDYKIFTFNGKPKFIQAHFNKSSNNLKANFYSTDWIFQDFSIEEQNDKNHFIEKPKHLDKMLQLAESLSQGTCFLRVDIFYINDKIYFGELTFYNWGGFGKFTPDSHDKLFGLNMTLPLDNIKENIQHD